MKYLIISLLFVCTSGWSQTKKKTAPAKPVATKPVVSPAKPAAVIKATTAAEWDELDKTFVAFFKALESQNKQSFSSISLKQVDCAECPASGEAGDVTHFVPNEIFYITVASDFKKSPVYKAVTKRGYAFNSMILKDFKPEFLPKDAPEDLKVYEVWVQTYKPDELSKGHKGTSHAFQFVKVNGVFRFFGLTSQ
ncbi:hypothetical protein AMR72_03490 [Flavobacterium psychrophilum]|nr:hypothetical protein AMR72_03490 [Flavobacterium psychrophilum]AOE51657.1 hypothetical protein ALW18_03490 [Flavobacterium psychrophilum]